MRVFFLLDCTVGAHASQIAFLLLAHQSRPFSRQPYSNSVEGIARNTPPLLLHVSSRYLMYIPDGQTPDATEGHCVLEIALLMFRGST